MIHRPPRVAVYKASSLSIPPHYRCRHTMPSQFIYHDPSIASLLILSNYFYFLNLFGWAFEWLLSAGLLGQILIGIIWGSPLAGWLHIEWQETFVVVGYVGLLLVVFDGKPMHVSL